jgi:hypothetical protein
MQRRRSRWCWWKVLVEGGFAANDLSSLLCEVRDHVLRNGHLNEVVQSGAVLGSEVC